VRILALALRARGRGWLRTMSRASCCSSSTASTSEARVAMEMT
jgi:hypothetical protein